MREAGYHETIYLHGAVIALCELYSRQGIELGSLEPVQEIDKKSLQGKIIMAPPSALNDRWSRRLPDPICAMASGWMAIRARARQRQVELPLVISDHADWDELTQTLNGCRRPGSLDYTRARRCDRLLGKQERFQSKAARYRRAMTTREIDAGLREAPRYDVDKR